MPNTPSPYLVQGPALISFSGGRTSGRMLKGILDAHDGKLPDDVHVCFSNTGKENEKTLRFVHECSTRWAVPITWLEWKKKIPGRRKTKADWAASYEIVGFNSASRNGEPFEALIRSKRLLPNPTMRYCTQKLKIETMKAFMKAQGYKRWTNPVGLRFDEMRRITKQVVQNESGRHPFTATFPLFDARVTKADVWQFWLGDNVDPRILTYPLPQGFDLGLYPYEGNCDGCFMKGREIVGYQERERPGYLDWWVEQETVHAGQTRKPEMAQFTKEWSYSEIKNDVSRSPLLIPVDWRSLEFDAECGVSGADHTVKCGGRS